MRSHLLLTILSVLLFSSSCRKSKASQCNEPELDCKGILCFVHINYFEFKLVDKVSGEDLIFNLNPRYTINDINLFADAARTRPISLTADIPNKKIQTISSTTEMYLEIKGATIYKLTGVFKLQNCCTNRIKSLKIDNISVCVCCSDIINIPVN